MKTLPLIFLLLLATTAHARDVNKCVDARGNIMLTDEPCSTVTQPKSESLPPPPSKPVTEDKSLNKPLPPILPAPEQQIPQAPPPAPAAKPAPAY